MANGGSPASRKAPNALAQNAIYKIHPATGVARVGSSPADFFLGPEIPGKGPTGTADGVGSAVPNYKDGGFKVKRQAARFYIWKYVWNPKQNQFQPKEEINLKTAGIKSIKWKVQLANRKASFFEFQGTNGETSPYAPGFGYVSSLRNSAVTGAARDGLEIAPDEVVIDATNRGPVKIEKSGLPITYLGELRTDTLGRLLVLGGQGLAKSSKSPRAPLPTYANNDDWFDDISDGPVSVEVEFDKRKVPQEDITDAWVLAGPPDFAPFTENLVTLYDRLCDVTVQHVAIPANNGIYDEYAPGKGIPWLRKMKADFAKPGGFTSFPVSFSRDIYPIVQRVKNYSWVHGPAAGHHGGTFPWSGMADSSAAGKGSRDMFFGWIRKPKTMNRPADPALMADPWMPKLLGDEAEDDASRGVPAGNPDEFLSLTDLQWALLLQWWKGNFTKDKWPADNKPTSLPPPSADVTPEGLDRAALEACVGGAFYPGIEVSWLVRNPKLYSEPFRVDRWERDASGKIKPQTDAAGTVLKDAAGKPLGKPKTISYGGVDIPVRAGFFSQQMALPWHADFLDCKPETHKFNGSDMVFGWWPAQRPDGVEPEGAANPATREDWIPAALPALHETMVDYWDNLRFVEPAGAEFVGKEATPPPPPPVVPAVPASGTSSAPDGICFVATASFGSPLAPEVQFLQHFRDNVLRQTEWGREFFERYWKHYYRISPPIAAEMRRDPEMRSTIRWSIVEPWSNYLKLALARPDWDRVNFEALDPALRDFLQLLRSDMEKWVSAIEVPHSFEGLDPAAAIAELNIALGVVKRTGGRKYLSQLTAEGALPLRYPAKRRPELVELLRGAGRSKTEIAHILGRKT